MTSRIGCDQVSVTQQFPSWQKVWVHRAIPPPLGTHEVWKEAALAAGATPRVPAAPAAATIKPSKTLWIFMITPLSS
ncbi:hypothetical protein [uncultured Stenotrophomonas sp.]|uniref:hypothetical protein n=1 Tax=uncultured Stenotrophomonas sp. TaxID=165438 RepID=UPI0025F45B5C|nr:hypothetical protein [uncultured Stenotrophomonas sp.]